MSASSDPEFDPEAHTAGENLEASKSHALDAAEELKAAATQKAQEIRDAAVERSQQLRDIAQQRAEELRHQATEKSEHLRDYAEEQWTTARSQIDDLKEEGEQYVRQNPTKAVLIALALGFIIGLIIL